MDDPQLFFSRSTLFLGSVFYSKKLVLITYLDIPSPIPHECLKTKTLFPLLSNLNPISDFPAANIIIIFPIMQAD